MLDLLAGKSVIVTGASKGIGRGIATVFARNGAKVLLVARDGNAGEQAAAAWRPQFPGDGLVASKMSVT